MTTVAALRTGYVNALLGRENDADTIPWTTTHLDRHIVDVLRKLWPTHGRFVSGTVAPSQSSDIYTIPSALTGGRISRIELEQSSGGVSSLVDRVTDWRYHSDTQVRVRPLLPTDSTLLLRFYGWVPFAVDASDIPARIEPAVGERAAGFAYGQLGGQLVNYKRQQGLDSGRVVDYPTAVGLSAYFERRYFEQMDGDPSMVSYAPRRSKR